MRNMIEASKLAFSNLITELNTRENYKVPGGKRHLKTDENEEEWLKRANITDYLHFTPSSTAVMIEFSDELYIAICGLNITSENLDPSVLKLSYSNAGLLTLLISEDFLNLGANIQPLEFYDKILFQHEEDSYDGHDHEELSDYLSPLTLYSIPSDSILHEKPINRLSSYILANNPDELILDFQDHILEKVSDIALNGPSSISYTLMNNCMLSTKYKHAFLELYRLIERLFPVKYLKEFHEHSKSQLEFLAFTATLEEITNWRPQEDHALGKLFEDSNSSTLDLFDVFKNSSSNLRGYNVDNLFYKLRNSIVHFRANHEEYDLNSDQWNMLLLATLSMIEFHYSSYDSIL